MKKIPFICAALIAMSPFMGWCEEASRQSMKDGIRFYEKSTYDSAAESFDRAAQAAQHDKLDASVAKYNAANARFKMGQFEAAATNFAEATRSPDLALQSRAYYNRGNSLVAGSKSLEQQGGLDTALDSVDEAIEMYENAMTLAPRDEDAKVNYELALKKKQELQQKQQEQKQQQQDQSQKKDEQKKQDQQKDQQQDQQKSTGQSESKQQAADQQKQQQPQKSEEMTPEEAKMMLDAMKQEEQASRDRMRLVIGQPTPVDKDW